jgi:hypothetical protein
MLSPSSIIWTPSSLCTFIPTRENFWRVSPFLIHFFCQPHTPQLLFVLGGKEVGGYPTVLKEKNMEKQKEYNLRYLLAKVRTT